MMLTSSKTSLSLESYEKSIEPNMRIDFYNLHISKILMKLNILLYLENIYKLYLSLKMKTN